MENNYKIKMTPKAAEDMKNIYEYISEELYAATAANNLLRKIEKEITRLKTFPFSCPYVSDLYLKIKGYRRLIVENYVVFYFLKEEKEKVVIVRILYGKQKYEKLL